MPYVTPTVLLRLTSSLQVHDESDSEAEAAALRAKRKKEARARMMQQMQSQQSSFLDSLADDGGGEGEGEGEGGAEEAAAGESDEERPTCMICKQSEGLDGRVAFFGVDPRPAAAKLAGNEHGSCGGHCHVSPPQLLSAQTNLLTSR